MRTTFSDLRFTMRSLSRQPGFAFVALSTLALGIGANSAIFAVIDAVLLRPLPFPAPSRLVLIQDVIRNFSASGMEVTPSDLEEYQQGSRTFESVAGYTFASMDLTGAGSTPQRLQVLRASAEIFPVLGISLALGRGFTDAEDHPGNGVAVISYPLWEGRFAGDPHIIGRVVDLDRTPTTIIGVLPRNVGFPLQGLPFGGTYDVWVPLAITPKEQSLIGNYNYAVVGRLKPGVTLEQARADAETVAQHIYRKIPVAAREGFTLNAKLSKVSDLVAQHSRRVLWLLAGAVGFVLLIACVNISNLLLGRAAGRQREMTIRSSLGASSARLFRQLLTESLLLSMGGGLAGLLLAVWLVPALAHVIPASVPRAATIHVDWRVVGFTTILSVAAGLLFGTIPAILASRTGKSNRWKEASQSATAGRQRASVRSLLVVSEVALSLMLLVAAGLLVRSLIALNAVSPGFDVQHILTARVTLPETAYPNQASVRDFFENALEALERIPGATAAGATTAPLLTLLNQRLFTVEDPSIPPSLAVNATVLGDYFRAVGIPLKRGRLFDSRDRANSEPVLIINEALAREYFRGKDAIGQQIRFGSRSSPTPWFTIIGVVADTKNNELANNSKPEVYQAYSQLDPPLFALGFGRSMVLAVRSASEPASLASAVRSEVARLDPQLPVSNLETAKAQIEKTLAPEWFQTELVASFAVLALLLAAIGIYGVVSFAVTQRTQEIGVRMALGASRRGVLGFVIGQGMKLVAMGLVLGTAGAFATSRMLAGFLFGIAPSDWITFSLAPVLLALIALAANFVPARRAAIVDPMVALRYE